MMLRACGREFRLQKEDFLGMGAIALGGVVLTEVVVNLVMALGKPDSYFLLGPFLLFLVGGFVAVMLSVGYWLTAFPMGVKMGATRREMVAGVAGVTVGMSLLLLTFPALDYLLERQLGVGYWVNTVGRALEFDLLYYIPWWGWPLAAVLCPVVGLLVGTVILRFGRKGFWVIWGIWMAGCFVPQMLPADFNFPVIGTPLWNALPWVGAAFTLALTVLAVRTLLRLPIQNQ